MRQTALLAATVSAITLAAAFAVGCSNSMQDAASEEEPQEEGDLGGEDTPKKTSSNSSSSSSTDTTEPAPDTSDAGATDPDASTIPTDPTNPIDTSMCTAGSVVEVESNDTAATANAIPAQTGTYCGGVASATDVDFATFTLPADAKGFSYGIAFNRSGVDATITAGAQGPFKLSQAIPVLPGQKYVLRVAGSQALAYRFSLNIVK